MGECPPEKPALGGSMGETVGELEGRWSKGE